MTINGGENIGDWPGVYAIINKTNGREYIGSSEKGVLSRINEHEQLLKRGKHNRKEMQEDYNKGCIFEAEILFVLPIGGTRKQLLSREIEEIKKHGEKRSLYNSFNWTMQKNPMTGKMEKIELPNSYYLPRAYGSWCDARDYEIVPRRENEKSDSVRVKVTPEIRAAASAAGQSASAYIMQAVLERMDRDGTMEQPTETP